MNSIRLNQEIHLPEYISPIPNLIEKVPFPYSALAFSPQWEVAISRKTKGEKQILDITVEDNGKGMAGDQIKVFINGQPVERSKGTEEEKSFGIGLAHIRKLVAKQNGRIVAERNKTRGMTFSLVTPLSIITNSDT